MGDLKGGGFEHYHCIGKHCTVGIQFLYNSTQTAEVYCPEIEVKDILVGKGLNAYKMC